MIKVLTVIGTRPEIIKLSTCIKEISKECFIPVTAGGGIATIEQANTIFRSGADKILFNSSLLKNVYSLVSRTIKKLSNICSQLNTTLNRKFQF